MTTIAGPVCAELWTHPSRPQSTVSELMLRHPEVLPATATLREARALLDREHVHMVLLSATGDVGAPLLGTLLGEDLAAGPLDDDRPALTATTIVGRTVLADEPAERVRRALLRTGSRRAAVVDVHGVLHGLLCLKRHGRGFCSDDDATARRAEARKGTGSR